MRPQARTSQPRGEAGKLPPVSMPMRNRVTVKARVASPVTLRQGHVVGHAIIIGVTPSIRYRVNSPTVIHEVIDGEAVIINLARGSYYSLDRVGADVWQALERGYSRAQVVSAIERAYEGEGIAQAVGAVLDQMLVEELIVEQEADAGSSPEQPPAGGEDARPASRPAFEPPVLLTYTDLQDLLLLDPIHQVDETGWPSTSAGPPRSTDDVSRR